jgi:membrane dipeptidase
MSQISKSELDKAKELHEKSIIIAGHTDFQYIVNWKRLQGENKVYERYILPQLKKGGISTFIDHGLNAAVLPNKNSSLLNFETILQDVEESPDVMNIATSVEDIVRGKKEGKITMGICTQGASRTVVSGLMSASHNREVKFLSLLYRLGMRCFQPASGNNLRNEFVDGCNEPDNAGLSRFGVKTIEEANRLGVLIDVAHMGDQGILDCAEVSKDPICTSHSNPRGIHDYYRNISEEGIRAITEKGGVIGFHGMHYLLCPENEIPTLEHFIKVVKYIENLAGIDHVVIGPDIYADGTWPKERYRMLYPNSNASRWLALGDEWHPPYTESFETYDIWPHTVTQKLVHEGYSDQEIKKILGENWLRIYKKVWGK